MNDLKKWFEGNTGRRIHKWAHYFEVYDRHFSKYRDTDVCVVEFGVSQGGSLQMWRDYFGSDAKIYGVDINEQCKTFEEEGTEIFIGDQGDRNFLKSLTNSIPRIDILIDDGGHTMDQQIRTFEELFPYISKDGIYLCEDCLTSYWKKFGGGYKHEDSFIEYCKNLIDEINAWHSKTRHLKVTNFTKMGKSMHFYDSIVVIEKGEVLEPVNLKTGNVTIPNYHPPKRWDKRLTDSIHDFLRNSRRHTG